ncbi:spindle pole body component 110-like [Nicotiana tomentosiformis]|uniref:spindle pole body component 110-like n=1 Tax=Nicotiana tomentosiformis TaxID=4098 RepID=UPI00388CA4AE
MLANKRGKNIAEKGDESGSDVDVDDLRMMEEGLTQLERRLEGSTRTIAIPMDRDLLVNIEEGVLGSDFFFLLPFYEMVILEIKGAPMKKRSKEIFVKLKDKYFEYNSKYRDLCRRFREGIDMQAFQDDLKEKDDELVEAIKKCSVLEGTLRSRGEDLEVSRGVEAQCSDLQAQVVELRGQLEECQLQLEAFNSEIVEKQNELVKAESSRLDARRKTKMLELANKTLRAERVNDQSMARVKEDRLEERIRELEKDNSIIHDRVAILEVALEDARVKACEDRVACGYAPTTPPADEANREEGIDRLEENAWYNIAYPQGKGGDGDGDRYGKVAKTRDGEGQ